METFSSEEHGERRLSEDSRNSRRGEHSPRADARIDAGALFPVIHSNGSVVTRFGEGCRLSLLHRSAVGFRETL
jgi:hypothetical protein